ncbi:hypothetical protein T439DRAFT_354864 [Meredithblackwellia eburnea MCA 4105]
MFHRFSLQLFLPAILLLGLAGFTQGQIQLVKKSGISAKVSIKGSYFNGFRQVCGPLWDDSQNMISVCQLDVPGGNSTVLCNQQVTVTSAKTSVQVPIVNLLDKRLLDKTCKGSIEMTDALARTLETVAGQQVTWSLT